MFYDIIKWILLRKWSAYSSYIELRKEFNKRIVRSKIIQFSLNYIPALYLTLVCLLFRFSLHFRTFLKLILKQNTWRTPLRERRCNYGTKTVSEQLHVESRRVYFPDFSSVTFPFNWQPHCTCVYAHHTHDELPGSNSSWNEEGRTISWSTVRWACVEHVLNFKQDFSPRRSKCGLPKNRTFNLSRAWGARRDYDEVVAGLAQGTAITIRYGFVPRPFLPGRF